jgi:hypothetical protein
MGIERNDFALASSRAVDKNVRAGEWFVYRHYKVEGAGESAYLHAPLWWAAEPDDPAELELYKGYKRSLDKQYEDDPEFAAYLAAQGMGIDQKNEPERYIPLDYHDLFLQFANLLEEGPITPEVVIGWAEQYGVLGLQRTSVNGMGNPRGGPAESVSDFAYFAEEANMVLRLYEAITAPEGPDHEYLRKHIRVPEIALLQSSLAATDIKYEKDYAGEEVARAHQLTPSKPTRDVIEQTLMNRVPPERLKKAALDYVAEAVHLRVTGECYPRLYRQRDDTFRRGWGFKSLLGAMWLQMMWLMSASEEDIHRCPWCRKTVTFEPSPEQPEIDPGLEKNARKKYKTREDKIYCDDPRCKASWNYHFGEGKSSKHARKRKRERRKSDDD